MHFYPNSIIPYPRTKQPWSVSWQVVRRIHLYTSLLSFKEESALCISPLKAWMRDMISTFVPSHVKAWNMEHFMTSWWMFEGWGALCLLSSSFLMDFIPNCNQWTLFQIAIKGCSTYKGGMFDVFLCQFLINVVLTYFSTKYWRIRCLVYSFFESLEEDFSINSSANARKGCTTYFSITSWNVRTHNLHFLLKIG